MGVTLQPRGLSIRPNDSCIRDQDARAEASHDRRMITGYLFSHTRIYGRSIDRFSDYRNYRSGQTRPRIDCSLSLTPSRHHTRVEIYWRVAGLCTPRSFPSVLLSDSCSDTCSTRSIPGDVCSDACAITNALGHTSYFGTTEPCPQYPGSR